MEDVKIEVNSPENQRIKSKFVAREVLACFSYEMDEILKAGLVEYDDIENQYQTVCPSCYEPVDWDDDNINETEKCPYCKEEILFESDLETEPQEVFEWWIVSDFLYRKLKEKGKPVLEWGNNYYWGRTTTGQAIMLDGVISQICLDMEILEGQKYSWAE